MKIGKISFIIGAFIIIMAGGGLSAQEVLPVLSGPDTLPAEHEKVLLFKLSNNNFVFDAEYFSPLEDGYTWIGLQLQPELSYQVSSRFLIRGGVYLLKYSGRRKMTVTRPVFTAVYRPCSSFSLAMGTLYGSLNHRLPEPLYQTDRSIYDYPEEGIQALVHTSWLEGDYWLQWRNFILPDDPSQEELVFGTSSRFMLSGKEKEWRFSIPVYTLINHKGGQIDASPAPVHTFGNLAAGVTADKVLSGDFFKKLTLQMLVYNYFDQSNTKLFDFSSGFGIQPEVGISGKHLSLRGGYWYGHDFYSRLGEPLFASVSRETDATGYPNRHLLTLKAQLQKHLEKGLNLFFYGNGFFDMGLGRFDYNVGLQLLFNMDFKLLKLKG